MALGLTGCSADLTTSAEGADGDAVAQVSTEDTGATTYLWVQTASGGTLLGSGDDLTLTLEGVPDHLTRFTDRPMHDAYVVAPEDTARRWTEFFDTAAPNATLSYTVEGSDVPQIIVLTLGQPVYDADAATMTYPATRVAVTPDDLPDTTRHIDPPVVDTPSEFGAASLFIDGGSPSCWKVADRAAMQCQSANLAGKTLTTGTAHEGSSFKNAKLANAKMSGIDWTGTDFSYADLSDTDLTGANLTGINLMWATWDTLDIANSNLTRANFACSAGSMSGVDFTGTTLTGATFDYYQGLLLGWDPGVNPTNGAMVFSEQASTCGRV